MNFAEQSDHAVEIALDHFRESFLLAFTTMTDGLAARARKQAFEIIKFFEQSTNEEIWARLAMIPDPETGASLAESWIAQWQDLSAAVGKVA